ncbi:SLATT domain-containing protein [Erythrobacter sp.]|uniref:SLATT domain-containing protein n=1 Tax=Erythrobacter sp. TaxID=1042 RepID=UPI0025D97717|nr:SLATT domain-containing protein [Erythrobacter sp.]
MASDPTISAYEIGKELERIEEDCIHSGKSHFNAHERWSRYHYWLGIPAVIFSSIAGLAFFQDYPQVGGALSAIVAVLTALSTFLKPYERAAGHKSSGDQYLSLRNDARVFRTIRLSNACDTQSAFNGLDEFTKRRNELNQASAQFSKRDFVKARAGIEAGEAAHAVDKPA